MGVENEVRTAKLEVAIDEQRDKMKSAIRGIKGIGPGTETVAESL